MAITSTFEAESPKAHASRLLAELNLSRGERADQTALIAQAFREWEGRGMDASVMIVAKFLDGYPPGIENHTMVRQIRERAKELRGKSIDIS